MSKYQYIVKHHTTAKHSPYNESCSNCYSMAAATATALRLPGKKFSMVIMGITTV